jgi:pimeloyl-ACP methyl ester carboxylesterase
MERFMKKTIGVVLAHGAWMDGSSWNKVIALLRREGVKAVAAALPMTGFEEDVKAVESAIERLGTDAILVGHAYAGAVIGAAGNGKAKGLVYVAGLAPDQGETVAQVFGRGEPDPHAPKLAPDAYGMIYLPDEAFAAAFAQQASADEQAALAAVQRPIAPGCIMVPMTRAAWKELPSWYLIAEQDRMITPDNQRFMAERMRAKVFSHAADHVPSITAPEAVAHVVLEAARGAAG